MSLSINQMLSAVTSCLCLAEPISPLTPPSKQISQVFHSSVPIVSTAVDLAGKQIVSFSNLWKDPFTAVFGGLLSLLIMHSMCSAADSGSKLISHMQEGAGSGAALAGMQFRDLKKFLLEGVSLAGVSASASVWAEHENIISLGKASYGFKIISYGASCIACSNRAYAEGKKILERWEQLKEVQDGPELVRLEQKQLLGLLDFAADSTTALWAFMGIFTMVSGLLVTPPWLFSLLTVAGVLAISALSYRIHLSNIYPVLLGSVEAL